MNGLILYIIFVVGMVAGWLMCAAVTGDAPEKLTDDEIRRRQDKWDGTR